MLEHKWVTDVDLSPDLFVHGINIGLIHTHTFLCQGGGVVDRYIM